MNPSLPEQRIISESFALFARFGIKNVTMDDIARHLGMSKKTIYQHYDDKNKLVKAIVQASIEDHVRHFEDFVSVSKNAIEEMLHIMNYMSSTFAKINPNMFYDMQRYHPEAWQHFRSFKEKKAYEHITANLEKGKSQGLYRKDFSIRILAQLRLEEVELAINPACFPADKYNLHDVQVQLLDHFLHGICTLKGHKLLNKYKQLTEDED
ncbi:MAG: TetR/AcrR family transcriptional regulator [Bacteroidia bacterium]|nr:TetR/AcrR family transcriptional regulator [Bacteroidia bacterium]